MRINGLIQLVNLRRAHRPLTISVSYGGVSHPPQLSNLPSPAAGRFTAAVWESSESALKFHSEVT